MKKTIILFVAFMCAITASADLIKDGFVEYVPNFVRHTATITLLDFEKVNQEVYTLPSSIRYEDEEYVVTEIDERALKNGRKNTVCKKIIVPPSITVIGKAAFREFMNVKEIELQSQLVEIPISAFSLCESLETITLPEGVKVIGSKVFSGCKALKSINIPNSVTTIYDQAFSQTAIKEISLPEGMTTINDGAFENMKKLQKVTIPSSVTTIGDHVFKYCDRLSDISLPAHLQSIGDGSFGYCKSLVNITIPADVSAIGVQAFIGCSELIQMTFPGGIGFIGREAFKECSNLESLIFTGAIPPMISFSAFDFTKLTTVYVPRGCGKSYKENAGDGAYRPFLENINVVETDNDPDVTLMLMTVEEKHKILSAPFEGSREEVLIQQKYVELYNALSPNANSANNVILIYRIQKLFNRNLLEVIKKPLAKDLKAAKTTEDIQSAFSKYLR